MNRYPPLKRVDGRLVCRGCGGAIPKGRRTWCSRTCYQKHDIVTIKGAVYRRAGGRCELCDYDLNWRTQTGKRRQYEYDHTIPVADGGPTILENIRLLCVPCHREVTKKWLANRKKP